MDDLLASLLGYAVMGTLLCTALWGAYTALSQPPLGKGAHRSSRRKSTSTALGTVPASILAYDETVPEWELHRRAELDGCASAAELDADPEALAVDRGLYRV